MIYPALVQSYYSGTRIIDGKPQYDKGVSVLQTNLKISMILLRPQRVFLENLASKSKTNYAEKKLTNRAEKFEDNEQGGGNYPMKCQN